MSLEQEVATYGAKGAVLNYIRSNAPEIPIQPFILVPVGQDWREHEREINRLDDSLVRSSSPLEDGQEMSFAGLFETTQFSGQQSVDYVMASLTDENTLRYAQIHGVTDPLTMGLVFQKDSGSTWNWGMVRHPHQENIIFIMGRPVPDHNRDSENLVFDEKTGKLQEVQNYCLSKAYRHEKQQFEPMSKAIGKAIELYQRIESLPAFQTGFSYHMEFGTDPVSVYQFRPFRRKQKATWEINFEELEKSERENEIHKFGISFGITEREGLDLKVARALSTDSQKKHLKRYRQKFAGKPSKHIVGRMMRSWNLSPAERVYAEEVANIPADTWGSVDSEAFERAVERLNAQSDKKTTCLYQENLHYHFGRDIDLSFPNARAWIANGGIQFLSHNWFRAVQAYDHSLLGYSSIYGRTGDNVRIFSDGNIGLAVEKSPYR